MTHIWVIYTDEPGRPIDIVDVVSDTRLFDCVDRMKSKLRSKYSTVVVHQASNGDDFYRFIFHCNDGLHTVVWAAEKRILDGSPW